MPDHALLPSPSSKPFPFGKCDIGHHGSLKGHSAAVKLCEELKSECSRGVREEQSCPGGLLSFADLCSVDSGKRPWLCNDYTQNWSLSD